MLEFDKIPRAELERIAKIFDADIENLSDEDKLVITTTYHRELKSAREIKLDTPICDKDKDECEVCQ